MITFQLESNLYTDYCRVQEFMIEHYQWSQVINTRNGSDFALPYFNLRTETATYTQALKQFKNACIRSGVNWKSYVIFEYAHAVFSSNEVTYKTRRKSAA